MLSDVACVSIDSSHSTSNGVLDKHGGILAVRAVAPRAR